MLLGEKIRAARKRRGFTLKELGDLVGTTHSALSQVENGKSEPMQKTLIALAKALDDNFGEIWLDEHLQGNEAPRSKKEFAEEMTASEWLSLKFPGRPDKQTKAQAEALARLLDAEVERIKREGY